MINILTTKQDCPMGQLQTALAEIWSLGSQRHRGKKAASIYNLYQILVLYPNGISLLHQGHYYNPLLLLYKTGSSIIRSMNR